MTFGRRTMCALLAILLVAGPVQAIPSDLSARLAALDARDPLQDPRRDLPQWQALLANLPADADSKLRLQVLRGTLAAALQDQQPVLARTLYQESAQFLAEQSGPQRDLAAIHAWGAVALLKRSDDAAAKAALAAAHIAAPPADPAAQSFVAAADSAFSWARDRLPETIANDRRAYEAARAAFGPSAAWTLSLQLAYAERAGYLKPDEAIRLTDDAEGNAATLSPDHALRPVLLYRLGDMASQRGRRPDAVQLLQRSIDLGRQLWGEYDPRLFAIVQRAALIDEDLVRGEALVRAAVAIAQRNPGLVADADLAMNHELLAHYLLHNGKPAEAVVELRRAVATLASVDPDDLRWPHIQVRLARGLAATGATGEAVALVRTAFPQIARKLPLDHAMHGVAATISARVLADAGFADEGFKLLQPVLAANEARVLDLVAREQSTGVLSRGASDLFKDAALVALLAGRNDDGLRYAELANLSDLAAATSYIRYTDQSRDAALRAALVALKLARETELKARRGATAPDATEPAQAALAGARVERQRAEAAFEDRFPNYLATLRPQPVPLADLMRQLAPGDAVVLPLFLGDRVATVVVTTAGLSWDMTMTGWGRSNAALKRMSASVDLNGGGKPFDKAQAYQAYRTVFSPRVAAALRPVRHLIFLSSADFGNVPPQLLVTEAPRAGTPTAWLIRRFAVSMRASLATPAAERAAGRGGIRFAGVGDPALGPRAPAGSAARLLRTAPLAAGRLRDLPSLPSATAELDTMRRAFGGASLMLTGTGATEAAVRATDLTPFGVVAFATHGLAGNEIAGLSEPALVMTPGAPGARTDDDGLLTASEIASLSLAADWVILSACNTAAEAPGGLRFSGLAQAFRLAGAQALLLSHWAVRDDAAARVTVATVRGAARGLSRPEALRRAQLALIDDRRIPDGANPAVWAPFFLVTH